MRRNTVKRFSAAARQAAQYGAKLSESGAPRGERRVYTLRAADGTVFESSDLGRIEDLVRKLTPNVY